MELCNGGNLETLLEAKGGCLSEVDARHILIQIVKGIAVIHQRGFMHRDLKLDNVMIHFPNLSFNQLFGRGFELIEYIAKLDLTNSGY